MRKRRGQTFGIQRIKRNPDIEHNYLTLHITPLSLESPPGLQRVAGPASTCIRLGAFEVPGICNPAQDHGIQ